MLEGKDLVEGSHGLFQGTVYLRRPKTVTRNISQGNWSAAQDSLHTPSKYKYATQTSSVRTPLMLQSWSASVTRAKQIM